MIKSNSFKHKDNQIKVQFHLNNNLRMTTKIQIKGEKYKIIIQNLLTIQLIKIIRNKILIPLIYLNIRILITQIILIPGLLVHLMDKMDTYRIIHLPI